MSISTLGTLFQFIGGLGMFLYGMESMADGLQKFAGNRLQRVLEILTSNRLLGVLVGAGVTAIIQSSSATTVMVVGFVNAGIINLLQATGIIMGANIGTTVTSWIAKDIFRHHRCQKDEADVLMVKGKSWCDKNIKIVAAGSNDSGVSWIVEVAGKRIFHAGDHSRTSKARDTTIL